MIVLALSLLVGTAQADVDDAECCIQVKRWEGSRAGWSLKNTHTAELSVGEVKGWSYGFYAGVQYRITACADARAQNADVLVYQDGEIVYRDATTDREPTVTFTPEASGDFTVGIYLRSASQRHDRAAVALAVEYR